MAMHAHNKCPSSEHPTNLVAPPVQLLSILSHEPISLERMAVYGLPPSTIRMLRAVASLGHGRE